MTEHHDISCLDTLVEENRLALEQLQRFLDELSAPAYRHAFGPGGRQSLGKHVRHIIDHYVALLAGAGLGHIDYETRERDARLEEEPALAAVRVAEIRAGLACLTESASSPLSLRYPVEGASVSLSLSTSLGRELAFLTSHTVHHMALLGLLAEQLDIPLPESFGVHPSTLRHWRQQAERDEQATRRTA
jgi:uncharacterized damage-inducible protein DinB